MNVSSLLHHWFTTYDYTHLIIFYYSARKITFLLPTSRFTACFITRRNNYLLWAFLHLKKIQTAIVNPSMSTFKDYFALLEELVVWITWHLVMSVSYHCYCCLILGDEAWLALSSPNRIYSWHVWSMAQEKMKELRLYQLLTHSLIVLLVSLSGKFWWIMLMYWFVY